MTRVSAKASSAAEASSAGELPAGELPAGELRGVVVAGRAVSPTPVELGGELAGKGDGTVPAVGGTETASEVGATAGGTGAPWARPSAGCSASEVCRRNAANSGDASSSGLPPNRGSVQLSNGGIGDGARGAESPADGFREGSAPCSATTGVAGQLRPSDHSDPLAGAEDSEDWGPGGAEMPVADPGSVVAGGEL